ncbi:Bud-site selection protein [Lipomyces chichibuensis]|uniref:Bud-site selection protein n=1 Tax=Lipomyces chichibuensis TaxID=1546026 RepID=UPI003342F26C
MAAVSSTYMQPKRKRENVLWELDLLESKLAKGSKKPRLVRTKLAVDRINRKIKKVQQNATKLSEERKDTEVKSTEENAEVLAKRALELKRKLVENRIYYWIKELGRSLKKAKPFETQRIVRKLKEARTTNQEDEILKHEQELLVIKVLDTNGIAQAHLWKRLRRNRFLYASQLLPNSPPNIETDKSEKGEDKPEPELAAIKQDIIARLFKTKTVQTVVAEAVDGIVTAVELAHNSLNSKKETKSQGQVRQAPQPDYADEGSNVEDRDEVSDSNDEDQGSDEVDGDHDDDDKEGSEDEDEESSSEIDISQYEGLIVNESDEGETEGDADDENIDYNEISDEDPELQYGSDGREESVSLLEPAIKQAKSRTEPFKTKVEIPKTDVKMAQTIVLPSLNVGYISPSESDDDLYDEEHNAKKGPTTHRKNRRGQRARQKIWEQKYGKNAAHLKRKEQERTEKEQRKQTKRRERLAQRGLQAIDKVTDSAFNDQKSEHQAVENKPLHPSWEARQQKNKHIDFKGKKIVFE